MARLVIYLILAIGSAISLIFFDGQVMIGLLTGVSTALLIPIIDQWMANGRYIRLGLASLRLRNQQVRVSVSYLFRIEDRGKYLVIRGARYPDQKQPIGGVYKYHPSVRNLLSKWKAQTDDLLPADNASQGDLRLRISGRHLLDFVRWFETGKNREIGPWREFYEELVRSKILPADHFPHINAELIRRTFQPIRYSEHAQCHELLIADIFELLPNERQLQALRETQDTQEGLNTTVDWVNAEQVRRRGSVPGAPFTGQIAETVEWTLQ